MRRAVLACDGVATLCLHLPKHECLTLVTGISRKTPRSSWRRNGESNGLRSDNRKPVRANHFRSGEWRSDLLGGESGVVPTSRSPERRRRDDRDGGHPLFEWRRPLFQVSERRPRRGHSKRSKAEASETQLRPLLSAGNRECLPPEGFWPWPALTSPPIADCGVRALICVNRPRPCTVTSASTPAPAAAPRRSERASSSAAGEMRMPSSFLLIDGHNRKRHPRATLHASVAGGSECEVAPRAPLPGRGARCRRVL